VKLDDRRWVFAALRERLCKRLAGVTEAPQEITLAPSQETAREELCLALHEPSASGTRFCQVSFAEWCSRA